MRGRGRCATRILWTKVLTKNQTCAAQNTCRSQSMTPYLVTYVISTISVHLATRADSGRSMRIVFGTLAVLIMSILAGLRDITVGGPDALLYGQPIFLVAHNSRSFSQAFAQAQLVGAKGEPGYILINYIVGQFTDSLNIFFFVHSLFVNGTILLAVITSRKYGPAWLMWLTYLCTFYVNTFNLLRQSEALALALFAISLLLEDRYRMSLFVGISGIMFHTSAAFFVPVYLIALIIHHRTKVRLLSAPLTIFTVGSILVGSIMAAYILGPSLFADQYGSYFVGGEEGMSIGVDFLYRLLPLAIGLRTVRSLSQAGSVTETQQGGFPSELNATRRLSRNAAVTTEVDSCNPIRDYRVAATLLVLLFAELAMFPIRVINPAFSRLVMYFSLSRVIGYAVFVSRMHVPRAISSSGLVLFISLYFYGIFVRTGVADYSSSILNIVGQFK